MIIFKKKTKKKNLKKTKKKWDVKVQNRVFQKKKTIISKNKTIQLK